MGDIIKLSSPATTQENCESEKIAHYWEIPVLFEDGDLLAIEKPADLLAVQNYSLVEAPNIQDLFNRDIERGAAWVKAREGLTCLNCVYPLDGDSSGILLFTKNKTAQDFMSNYLGSEIDFRTYHALVHGSPREKEFTVNAGLIPSVRYPGTFKVDVKRGKRSITRFKLLESFNGYSYMECHPITERFLQIRAHLHYIKCPAVCDSLYFGRPLFLSSLKKNYRQSKKHEEYPLMGRAALHCSRVEFPHPVTGETIVIESPLPKDFRVALKMLRQYSLKLWEPMPEPSGSSARRQGFGARRGLSKPGGKRFGMGGRSRRGPQNGSQGRRSPRSAGGRSRHFSSRD